MTVFAGVDLSYTSPGVCVYDDFNPPIFESLNFFNLREDKTKNDIKRCGVFGNIRIDIQPKWTCAEERYSINAKWLTNILSAHKVEQVALEGYAMGARAGLIFNIAENTSLVKQFMFHNGIAFETPPPQVAKKLLTGKGNAKKEDMVNSFHALFPHVQLDKVLGIKEYAKPIDDLVDSFGNLLAHTKLTRKFK